jgi:NTP pyrophosphatase (non-canonical NTP hydrolase)
MINDIDHEILSIAQEECAETIQAISKIFRFGFDSRHPDKGYDNREHLEEELGDLQCMINLMIEHGIVRKDKLNEAENKKYEKLHQWSNIFNEQGESDLSSSH